MPKGEHENECRDGDAARAIAVFMRSSRPKAGSAKSRINALGKPGDDLLSRALRHSTIGAGAFHGRVRDGIGCFAPRHGHQAGQTAARVGRASARLVERGAPAAKAGAHGLRRRGRREAGCVVSVKGEGLPRVAVPGIAAGNGSCRWMRALKPIERLVPVGCAGCPASTSGLSTWWSTTALGETWF